MPFSGKPPGAERRGLTPTLLVLLLLAAVLLLAVITMWLRRTPKSEPAQPGRRSGAVLRTRTMVVSEAAPERIGSGRHLT